MPSPAQIVRQVLIDNNLAIMPGKAQLPGDGTLVCFVPSLPDDYDSALAIRGSNGVVFGKSQRGKILSHPGLLFMLRQPTDDAGYDTLNNINTVLNKLACFTTVLDGVTHYIQSIYSTSNVVQLGEEVRKRRWLWSLAARICFQDAENYPG